MADEFVREFRNLSGVTIAERQKQLYKLLNRHKHLKDNATLLDSIVLQIKPTTYLETLFRIELLLFFRRTEDLKKLLQIGDDLLISKVLKQKWFIQELGKVQPEALVNTLLPTLSFIIRMKVLKKLALYVSDEKYLSEVFCKAESRYGLFIATTLLPACDSKTIKETIANKQVILSPGQLCQIYNKYPRLVNFYIENTIGDGCEEGELKNQFNHVLKHIAEKNYDDYYELHKKYNFTVKIGRRLTKKITNTNRKDLISNPENYKFEQLHKGALVRKLGPDFKLMYEKLFPKYADEDLTDVKDFLTHCPKKGRFELFEQTFESVTNKTLTKQVDIVGEELLGKIRDVTKREAYVQLKMKKDDLSEETLISYLGINKSVPQLKQKINVSSGISDRKNLLVLMIKTCSINEDLEALSEVGRYICTRHRNDNSELRLAILRTIQDSFNLNKFRQDQWSFVKDFFIILKLQNDPFDCLQKILLKYMEFSYVNRLPFEEFIPNYVKIDPWYDNFLKNKVVTNKPFKKYLLIKFIEHAPQIDNPSDKIDNSLKLIETVTRWNKKNLKYEISFKDYPHLFESVKTSLKTNIWFTFNMYHLICVKSYQHCYYEITDLLWANQETKVDPKVSLWYLKHTPEIISKNFNVFTSKVLDDAFIYCLNKETTWRTIKKYDHLNFPAKTIDYCNEKIAEKKYDFCTKLTEALGILLEPSKFIEIVNQFQPVSYTIDLRDEKTDMELFKFQCNLLGCLKYFKPSPELVISTIFNYCKGDYLGKALSSLYSVFYHTPENNVPGLIERLTNECENASARKHYLFLISQLCSLDSNLQLLGHVNETSYIVTRSLFRTALNLFKKNSTPEFWELFKKCAANLTESDTPSLESLVEPKSIVREYWSDYIKFVWQLILQNKSLSEKNSDNLKIKLLNSATDAHNIRLISYLDQVFCAAVSEQIFLNKIDKTYNLKWGKPSYEYVSKLILFHKNGQEVIKVIFKILRKLKSDNFTKSSKSKKLALREIDDFFDTFYQTCLNDKARRKLVDKKTTLEQFTLNWLETFSDTETFLPNLQLKLLNICVQLKEENEDVLIQNYTKKVCNLTQNINKQFGVCLFENISIGILRSLKYFYDVDIHCRKNKQKREELIKMKFVKFLLEIEPTEVNSLIAFKFMKKSPTRVGEVKKMFIEILDILEKSEFPSVIVNVNAFRI